MKELVLAEEEIGLKPFFPRTTVKTNPVISQIYRCHCFLSLSRSDKKMCRYPKVLEKNYGVKKIGQLSLFIVEKLHYCEIENRENRFQFKFFLFGGREIFQQCQLAIIVYCSRNISQLMQLKNASYLKFSSQTGYDIRNRNISNIKQKCLVY